MDFTTIEHDFLHVKDYFSNYKFTYKERRSKLDFLMNINNNSIQDTSSLISSSKEQLVEVKNVYKKIDEEIKEHSKAIHEEKEGIKLKNETLERLLEEETMLTEEYERLINLNELIIEQDKLNSEIETIEKELEALYEEIDSKKRLIDPYSIEAKKEEEKTMREERNELAAKQKRLTLINTENYIEDIYSWNRQYLDILERIFGIATVSGTEDKSSLKISKNDSILEINIRNKKLLDCYVSKNFSFDKLQEFEMIKEYSISIDNAKPLLLFFLLNC